MGARLIFLDVGRIFTDEGFLIPFILFFGHGLVLVIINIQIKIKIKFKKVLFMVFQDHNIHSLGFF